MQRSAANVSAPLDAYIVFVGSRLGRRPKRLKQCPGGLDGQHSDFKSATNHASSSLAQQSPTYNGHVAKLGTSLQMLRCSEQIEGGGDLQRNQHHNKSRLSEQEYYSPRSDCLKSASTISSSKGNADSQKFSPMMNPSRMSNSSNRIQNGLSADFCYDDDLDFLGVKHQSVNNQTKYNYGNVHCDEDVAPSRSLVQEDDKKFVKDDISRMNNFSDWGAFKFSRNTHNEMMPHHRMAPSYRSHTSVPTRTLADNFTIEHRDCSASFIPNGFQERTCMFDTANERSYGSGEEKFQNDCQLTTAKEIKRSDSECFVDYSKVSSAGQCLSCSSDEVGSLEESAVDVHEADAFPNSVDSDEDPFKRMSFAKTSEVRRLLNKIKGGISPQKIAIINQVIETITTSHLNTCNYTYAKVIAGLKKYEELKKSGQVSVKCLISCININA